MSISSLSRPNKATRPLQSPTQSARPDRPRPTRSPFATHTVVTVLVLLLALGTGFFAPHFSNAVLRTVINKQVPSFTLRNPIVLQEPSICPKPEQQVEFVGTFNTPHKRSMTLKDQAKRVAAEFDFDDNAVNKAVKEFIREMGTHENMEWAIGH